MHHPMLFHDTDTISSKSKPSPNPKINLIQKR
jgi:hypothetical protein